MFQTVQVDNLILKECMYSSNMLFEPKFGGSLLTWLWFQTSIIPTIPHSILQACRLSFFPGGLTGKEFTCSVKDLGLIPGFGKIPWRRERLPTAVFWPGEFRELYSSWGRKESDMTEIFTHPFACLKPFNSFCLFLWWSPTHSMALTQPVKPSLVKLILQSHSHILYSSHPCLFRPWYLPCSPLPLGLCTCSSLHQESSSFPIFLLCVEFLSWFGSQSQLLFLGEASPDFSDQVFLPYRIPKH